MIASITFSIGLLLIAAATATAGTKCDVLSKFGIALAALAIPFLVIGSLLLAVQKLT